MIGSDLEGAGLESRVASWAASATSDDAAAVRAVIEAYGDRLAAADVGRRRQSVHGNAAVMQPSSKPSYGVSSLRPHRTLLSRTCAWTLRSDSTTSPSKASSGQSGRQARGDHDPRYRRDATRRLRQLFVLERTEANGRSRRTCSSSCRSSRRGLLRHLASPPPGSGTFRIRLRSPSTTRRRRSR